MLFIAGFDPKVMRMKEADTVKVENEVKILEEEEEEYDEEEQQLEMKDSEETRNLFVSFLYGLDGKSKTLRFGYALFQ